MARNNGKITICRIVIITFFVIPHCLSLESGGCPFGRRMSSAEKMHSATLGSFNDSQDREIFESRLFRQRRDEQGIISGIRSYIK